MARAASPKSTLTSLVSGLSSESFLVHTKCNLSLGCGRRIFARLSDLTNRSVTERERTTSHSCSTFVCKITMGFLCIAVFSQTAFGQLNSNSASVVLTATLPESLSISVTPSSVNFPLVAGGVAAGSNPIMVTTSWVLSRGRTEVDLYGYFANPDAALNDGGTPPINIPSSAVLGEMPSWDLPSFLPFTYTNPVGPAGASLRLAGQRIGDTNEAFTRTDALSLQIDLSNQPGIPAGTFTGTLTLQAQAL